jgi:hypothetical protein
MANSDLSTESLINAAQNENSLWDISISASEEKKDLAWKTIESVVDACIASPTLSAFVSSSLATSLQACSA